jgi:hypothetical protein
MIMKTIIKSISFICLCLLVISGCKPKKELAGEKQVQKETVNSTLENILRTPVNSADPTERTGAVYSNNVYLHLQADADLFKDNAPFIEYLNEGRTERLWFASSRPDTVLFGVKETNHYQQVYYCEREVKSGMRPADGWSTPVLFQVSTDNPLLQKFTDNFNNSTKGAPTIAGNVMILSSDQLPDTLMREFKDLWEITRTEGRYINPKPLDNLCFKYSWESQPALSPNGKHLFYISNRKVNPADTTVVPGAMAEKYNIYYSFKEAGRWRDPVLVRELFTKSNQLSPHVLYNSGKLLFSSDREGNFQIYEVGLSLNDATGGYSINQKDIKLLSYPVINTSSQKPVKLNVNDENDQQYPFLYYNPLNKFAPRVLFWASNDPKGFGSYDIYACAVPYQVNVNVILADKSEGNIHAAVPGSNIRLDGFQKDLKEGQSASFQLFSHLPYQIYGGSSAVTHNCDLDQGFIHIGYSEIMDQNQHNRLLHNTLMTGPTAQSNLTKRFGKLPLDEVLNDTTLIDTIFITKAWLKKPPCPASIDIHPKYYNIAYFQTGFWEVNTTENLNRDLKLLHEGFKVDEDNNLLDPTNKITRLRSDYVNPFGVKFPIIKNDGYKYSIANAAWIELHPNNSYWGYDPNSPGDQQERLNGRKDRINQYVDFAKKVDENLKVLTDTILETYISVLDEHRDKKPQLLIEIFAVSDQRDVSTCWYVGPTISYRSSSYNENQNSYPTSYVVIVAPEVDEQNKKINAVKPCTSEFNLDGDNGSILGQPGDDKNINLSRLRAWYGYLEVYKILIKAPEFAKYVDAGKVALPDNKLPYKDAEIIIITRDRREGDENVEKTKPYPKVNNRGGNGYYDYDKIRRMEVHTRLIYSKDTKVEAAYCCEPGTSK